MPFTATESRPNVVLIVADDMGYGDFGSLNDGASSTPSLDQLAAEGLLFTQHYSASPVCAPARAALLTGRYAQRTGVIDTLEARGTDRLALRETTIADVLGSAGYRTGLVGKWHCGAIGTAYTPWNRGFDEFIGFRGGWQDYWDWRLERNGRRFAADGRYLTDVITEESVEFIRRNAGTPFFLHVAYNSPHFPFQAPEELVDAHRKAGRTETVAIIYAMLEVMDGGVGSIRQALADAGLADNTLFIFTSDNGPDHGGSGTLSAARYNGGLAGQKQYVYDGGIRLPLLASWPDGAVQGVTSQFVHFTDWFPTLLRLADSRDPDRLPLDGIDISAVFGGGAADVGPRFWQWSRYRPLANSNAAVRDGRWKLVHPALDGSLGLEPVDEQIDFEIKKHPERFPEPVDGEFPDFSNQVAAAPQLFDLETDPGESTDVSAAHADIVTRLESELIGWFESVEQERLTASIAH